MISANFLKKYHYKLNGCRKESRNVRIVLLITRRRQAEKALFDKPVKSSALKKGDKIRIKKGVKDLNTKKVPLML